ncbi:MAG: 5-formyltetrahydrofolate cyclo-ligase [Bacteroidaceae bacterium]
MTSDKKTLRRWVREQKAMHTPAALTAESLSLCRSIMATPEWRMAGCVLLYHALSDEVHTSTLLEDALHRGKRVILPVVAGDMLLLRGYDGRTVKGAFGIDEPIGPTLSAYDEIDLAIVPGMAFDAHGNRLGRGKGFYDRLLPMLHCPKWGICFSFQLVDTVPSEAHDMPMDRVFYL